LASVSARPNHPDERSSGPASALKLEPWPADAQLSGVIRRGAGSLERQTGMKLETIKTMTREAGRGALVSVLAAMTIVSSQAIAATPALAESGKPASARLSEPAPVTVPELPIGDLPSLPSC